MGHVTAVVTMDIPAWEQELLDGQPDSVLCPICGQETSPDEDFARFHTRRDRLSRWLRANVTKHLWP
jgi:hypothetical protein